MCSSHITHEPVRKISWTRKNATILRTYRIETRISPDIRAVIKNKTVNYRE